MFEILSVRSETLVEGVAKVINELGLMILAKDIDIEIELKQEEIDKLKKKIETIEQYLDMYEENCNYEFVLKRC